MSSSRRGRELCEDIAAEGVKSLLVIDEDLTPFPSGQAGGVWCLVRPFANPMSPSPSELQRIRDFVLYETSHSRKVAIWIGYNGVRELVLETARRLEAPNPLNRPPTDDPCCCRPWHDGCSGRLLCHAAPAERARQILESGRLLSKRRLTGLPLAQLALENGFGDPPDYFDYVCLANANCVAPDIVCLQRQAGRYLGSEECNKFFYPGARFFFDPVRLLGHPRAEWDGIQPMKVMESLELMPYLAALVLPSTLPDGTRVKLDAPDDLGERIIYLDHREHFGLAAWSAEAFERALVLQR